MEGLKRDTVVSINWGGPTVDAKLEAKELRFRFEALGKSGTPLGTMGIDGDCRRIATCSNEGLYRNIVEKLPYHPYVRAPV